MAYRSPDEVLRERAADLRAEIDAASDRIATKRAELATVEHETAAVGERLREAGPSAGPRGAVRDRVGLAAIALAVVGVLLVPLHIHWNHWVGRDNTVVPAILILAAPGALAALVSWPYRTITATCHWVARAGLILAAAPIANVIIGFVLEAR